VGRTVRKKRPKAARRNTRENIFVLSLEQFCQ
jgi:hypothetical protein